MLNCSPQKRKNLQINPYLILRLGERGGRGRGEEEGENTQKKYFNKNEKKILESF
jgi:hypothetical protein